MKIGAVIDMVCVMLVLALRVIVAGEGVLFLVLAGGRLPKLMVAVKWVLLLRPLPARRQG